MTDFFARLADRYQGQGNVLRPRVPFRFEPAVTSLAAAPVTGEPAAADPGRPRRRADGPGARDGSRGLLAPDPAQDTPAQDPAGELAWSRATDPGGIAPGPGRVAPDRTSTAALGPTARRLTRAGPQAGDETVAAPGTFSPNERADHAVAESDAPRARDAAAVSVSRRPAAQRPAVRDARTVAMGTVPPAGARAAAEAIPRTGADSGEPGTGPEASRRARGHAAAEPPGSAQESITVQVTIGRVEVRAAAPDAPARAASGPATVPSLADYLRGKSRAAP
jgi:hypothetical protein